MMARIKAGLISLRDLFATAWWIILIAGIGFAVAYQFVQPAPPTKIVITTGGESGAYYQFAKRYATLLAKNGITLEVKVSAGSLQNIERLKANLRWGIDFDAEVRAFPQGGSRSPDLPFRRKVDILAVQFDTSDRMIRTHEMFLHPFHSL